MALLSRWRRLLVLPAAIATAAVLMVVPATAFATECTANVSHFAAVYETPEGTGFIKNKEIGEPITGPDFGGFWVGGTFSPWVEVHVSGHPSGWMDINEIASHNTCLNPW